VNNTPALRHATSQGKAIALERLLIAQYRFVGHTASLSMYRQPAQAEIAEHIAYLCYRRAITLIRDAVDPRPVRRSPERMLDEDLTGSSGGQPVRGWRRRFPDLLRS
jgi:hypothetical protein